MKAVDCGDVQRAEGSDALAQQASNSPQLADAEHALRRADAEYRLYDRLDWAFLLLACPACVGLVLCRLAWGGSDALWRGGTLVLSVATLAHYTFGRSLQVRAERRRSEALAALRGLHEQLDAASVLRACGAAS